MSAAVMAAAEETGVDAAVVEVPSEMDDNFASEGKESFLSKLCAPSMWSFQDGYVK